MFELPLFRKCPKCKKDAFGTLSVGGTVVEKRCAECRYSHGEILPELDKRVVYLDQFAVSELYKTKTRRPGAPSEQFWQDCYALANRAYLRQQVIFPVSNLHSDETIVFHSPEELRLAHEMFSGERRVMDPCWLRLLCTLRALCLLSTLLGACLRPPPFLHFQATCRRYAGPPLRFCL